MIEKKILINDLKISYKITGSGKPFLILHGWGSNNERWQKVAELLSKKEFEIIIPDLPGFGESDTPSLILGIDDYSNIIQEFINSLNLKKIYLLGHSFGGGLAAKIASLYPEKIEKLILVAPAIIRKKNLKVHLFYYLVKIGKKIFSQFGLKKFQPQAQWLIYKLAGNRDYYLANGTMKEIMKKIKKEDLKIILEKIKVPTLILWGKRDDVLPLKDAYIIKEKIKNSELKVLQKARHSPHRESPEELVENITETSAL